MSKTISITGLSAPRASVHRRCPPALSVVRLLYAAGRLRRKSQSQQVRIGARRLCRRRGQ